MLSKADIEISGNTSFGVRAAPGHQRRCVAQETGEINPGVLMKT
jgi:hypothetical protein